MNKIIRSLLATAIFTPLIMVMEVGVVGSDAFAQKGEDGKSTRKAVRICSIRQKVVKDFEKVGVAFDEDNMVEANRLLDKIASVEDKNNIENAYLANYRGNIYFNKDNLDGALREFKKIIAAPDCVPASFVNQITYVIAQVYFSKENYAEALKYAQTWLKDQADPTADAYMLVGQAQYMLKRYDEALPNVRKGIQKYIDLGTTPKEGWLNLLSSIYRQKNDFKKMLPVLQQLVKHYPKKTYLLTMGGIYNELDDAPRMSAMYQAMYDQGILDQPSEIITLSSLLMSQDNPHKASVVMGKGIKDGILKKDLKNYRIYAQALYLSKEYQDALDPLAKAAKLSPDGKLYNQLGQSYIALNQWKAADQALSKALSKGKLTNTGQTLVSQGLVRFEQKKYKSAKLAFEKAKRYDKVAPDALNWIRYVDAEVYRIKELKKEIVINTDVEV